MLEKLCDWIGYVFSEASFHIMSDDMLERCILQALGETDEDIDGYITVSYTDYRWYDQAFFTLGSVLYRIGCACYARPLPPPRLLRRRIPECWAAAMERRYRA